jgi:polyisoprenoid-binding protein YceI
MLLRRRSTPTAADAGPSNPVSPTTKTNHKENDMTDSLVSVQSRTESDRLVPPPGTFEIDPVHTFVTFRAQHLVVGRVQGRFETVSGTVTVDENVLDSHVEVVIDAASIATHMPPRDDDLRSSNFLDVANYPNLTFESTGITELPSGKWSIAGDLTIKGISVPTELIVEFGGAVPDPFGNLRLGFHATTTISRRDFGLLHQLEFHAGSLHVARDVTIEIDVEAVHPL